ncbi:thiamine pyrophosphate-dependent enzyme [Enterobacter hormaechei]
MSGSLWGSRLFRANGPMMNIHSLAGAIGMGLPQAIGTPIANPQPNLVGLVGDGGVVSLINKYEPTTPRLRSRFEGAGF